MSKIELKKAPQKNHFLCLSLNVAPPLTLT